MKRFQDAGLSALLKLVLSFCLCCLIGSCAGSHRTPRPAGGVDVVVYSATPSGIMAAIEAARCGMEVMLLEPGQHVGGMTSSGLGFTDLYDSRAIGGSAKEFFATVHSIYGPTGVSDNKGTLYEPHVAEQAFLEMLGRERRIKVIYGAALASVQMSGTTIDSITTSDGSVYKANEFIDSSYEGDLMAAAHVDYIVGRESSSQYDESNAGVDRPYTLYGVVDPYVIPGNPSSGLLPHVTPNDLPPVGSADKSVMAYNYRLCATSAADNRIPFPTPADYDVIEFEVLARMTQAAYKTGVEPPMADYLTLSSLPNNKFDVNTGRLMSTDLIGASEAYPEASPERRKEIAAEHRRYMERLLHFLSTDSRIPFAVRTEVQSLGLCKDEFTDNGGWPRQLYVREARRMIGSYVMTQNDVQLKRAEPGDSIGLGGFAWLDSHHRHQLNHNGLVKGEPQIRPLGNHPYEISYRVLTPQRSQATNLLVSVAVSASQVAHSTLRMETTYMIMGQSAGAAAALAIDRNVAVQDVSYSALRWQLWHDGQVLNWD